MAPESESPRVSIEGAVEKFLFVVEQIAPLAPVHLVLLRVGLIGWWRAPFEADRTTGGARR